MDVHKNVPLMPAGREAMVRRVLETGLTPKAVSEAVGVSPKTVRKWVARFEAAEVSSARAATWCEREFRDRVGAAVAGDGSYAAKKMGWIRKVVMQTTPQRRSGWTSPWITPNGEKGR